MISRSLSVGYYHHAS